MAQIRQSEGAASAPVMRGGNSGDFSDSIPISLGYVAQAQAALLFERLTKNVKQNRLLARLRDLLLPRLLSGEIRVPEAEHAVEGMV